jgi:hypothetical protein
VLINDKQGFGNVLPSTIRRFEFTWNGEDSILDIGRYSAVVTLNFGDDAKQNISATTYFWVIPVLPLSIALGVIVLFVLTIVWFIKRYVRRALMLEHMRVEEGEVAAQPVAPATTIETLVRPIQQSVVDLRAVAQRPAIVHAVEPETRSAAEFASKYRLFFAFVVVLILIGFGLAWYFGAVLVESRGYEIHQATSTPRTAK